MNLYVIRIHRFALREVVFGCRVQFEFKAIESMDKAADPMARGSCSETVLATFSQCSTL